jgi:hypothetical protein
LESWASLSRNSRQNSMRAATDDGVLIEPKLLGGQITMAGRPACNPASPLNTGGSVPQGRASSTGQLSAGPFPKAFRGIRAIESICAVQFPDRPVRSAADSQNAAIITVMCSTSRGCL